MEFKINQQLKYKDEKKHKQPDAGDSKGKQPAEDTGSKQPAQSGKEASGEKNETAPAGKQSFVNLPKGGGAIHGMGEKFSGQSGNGHRLIHRTAHHQCRTGRVYPATGPGLRQRIGQRPVRPRLECRHPIRITKNR